MNTKEAPSIERVETYVRRYFQSAAFHIEREPSGVSTYVYRIRAGGETFYLRVLPEADRSLGVEVHAHGLLRDRGVRAPEVVGYEQLADSLGMSTMLVREIEGRAAGHDAGMTCASYGRVMREAGRQAALMHQVPVEGFGWIRRERHEADDVLRGEKGTASEYLTEFWEEDLRFLSQAILSEAEISRLHERFEDGFSLMARQGARLVHGDFDDSHIFQHGGAYTGIIDFGEMQGSSPLYDLGHFKLHDGQRFEGFRALKAGYEEVTLLTTEGRLEISLWTLWIGIRRMAIAGRRSHGGYLQHLTKAVRHELDQIGSER